MFRNGRKAETVVAEPGNNRANTNNEKAEHSIHFKAPVLMIASMLIGTFLALGLHLFFKSLDGQVVPSKNQQAWNGRYAVAITFLVKTFLSSAISVACVQNIWWLLRSRTAKLGTIDSLFGILGNGLLSLVDPRVWFFGPTVCILAVGVW